MASRNTQTSRIILQADAPQNARATQVSRVVVQAGAPQAARATQVSRVIIGTIPLAGGGFLLRGTGA
jgi:hypothetical protein